MLTLDNKFHRIGAGLSVPSNPQGIRQPQWIKRNKSLAESLRISPQIFLDDDGLNILSGRKILPGSNPVAQAYAGHQFGKFNPFLGDGRSVLLGELATAVGSIDLALKGSGKTPFTFSSHGRATLSCCLHEYSISEQLAAHGIPTTRCLSIIAGSDQLYQNGRSERVGVLARTAPSFVRFGSFEACYFRRDIAALTTLADYVIKHHFPNLLVDSTNPQTKYALFFQEVVTRTATLIASWQNTGFVHGMMNTDNLSIVGVTLDLGSSQFIEPRDDSYVASAIDHTGRYAFGAQPVVGLWSCNVLAKALSPLVAEEKLTQSLMKYEANFLKHLNS
ncbi:protein adenylyltransferase SelO family protein [Arenicella xantha]|uniref:YdiU/UPF0061 family uncharacterized protein n=1 Tax=Arenicella xantha TaxID=644221 RepID=A0A395JGQ3_9GAMM|nr:protein adenylyltransferase SelO family protein [Arenicella xantha]RBP49127.1 YdiU/UPF0061 family uncharacterized protein [Arenicella xantha]